MAYALHKTCDSVEVMSDLESVVGGVPDTPREQGPSRPFRMRMFAGSAALVVAGMILIVASGSRSKVHQGNTSATLGLSQETQTHVSWDQILLQEAREIDATEQKLKADEAEFRKTGGWEMAHEISKDHERSKNEEADFATAEAMSKQYPDPQPSTRLRAVARPASTVSASTTPQQPSSGPERSGVATGLRIKDRVDRVPQSATTSPTASRQPAEQSSTAPTSERAQVSTSQGMEQTNTSPRSAATESSSPSFAPQVTTSMHFREQLPESFVSASTTLASGSSSSSAKNLSALAEDFLAEANNYNSTSLDRMSMINIAQMLKKAEKRFSKVSALSNTSQHASLGESPLAPEESLHDGNKCPDDEEEYPKTGGTCFKKCSELTGGAYPIRSTAFSCCKSEPCSVSNSKIHLGFCGGFDVAGDAEGNGCPSSEGACLKDEELLGGICYKKCSSFEGGDIYHHRVAPNICCSSTGMRCLLPSYFKFSAKFAEGGGEGDSNSATPAMAHAPIQKLTEVDA
eukprot:TRINITY_DN1541_c0_g1_i13.p1 TRINITY_DN1541_c0_g1~~TRINITY_DN1541_c0_g1_i13.p1  ORF type:complete len:516 (-),score=98.75 TRINITY_DN1541_c0_g1_i13:407-1954(-)